MCYNKDVSIYTYILGLVSSYFLLINDKKSLKILGCFFMVTIQMQLVEYYLWNNNKCNDKNITISNIGAIANFIQPLALYLAIRYFTKDDGNDDRKDKGNNDGNDARNDGNIRNIDIVIIIYIIVLIIFTIRILPLGCSIKTPQSSPYLQWSWMYEKYPSYIFTYFPISIMLLLYFGLDKPYNIYLSTFCMISFLLSFIIYRQNRAFGNIWCWFTVFIPICVLIYDKYFTDDKVIE